MDDVTQRLRMERDPEHLDRERYMAGNLFGEVMRETDGKIVSHEQITRWARQSIVAACIFWQEWEIASLRYETGSKEPVYGYCVGEMR